MIGPDEVQKVTFSQVILQGSPYEVGVFQGHMAQAYPGWASFLDSGKDMPARTEMQESIRLFRKYCPGLEEEMQGLCDVLQIPLEHLVYIASTHLSPHHCSHLVALPAITVNQHVLVGRNYDFGHTMDDLRLCITRITGKYAHLGYSSLLFGRTDGVNEHGLSVTCSVGGLPVSALPGLRPPLQDGLQFWALVRAVLEACRTVDEALQLFYDFPLCGNPICLFADSTGTAALAEAFGAHKDHLLLNGSSTEHYLVATNHFHLPVLRSIEPTISTHSAVRHETARACLERTAPHVTAEIIQGLLERRYPDGLCCHYYTEFFGTLHSMVLDLNERSAWMSFGSPSANGWRKVSLAEGFQPGAEQILIPIEHPVAEFWKPV